MYESASAAIFSDDTQSILTAGDLSVTDLKSHLCLQAQCPNGGEAAIRG